MEETICQQRQWANIQDTDLKSTLNMIEIDQKDPQVTNEEEDIMNENAEDENPALEGHFLTERTMLDITIIDNCQCLCHREQHITLELNLPFLCSRCSQQFCCKCQFLAHRDFHRDERKYSCPLCDKSYYYKSDLARHEPVHSIVKPHLCKICGRSFNQMGHLITHRLVHTGEKPFSCDICHKPFNRKSNLQKHKMIHTGERPFMCLVCGSCFSRKGDLQRHTMLHTGERPYKCDLCDKSFSQKPHLLSHQSVHSGDKPYKCLACSKTFNRKSNLIKHQIAKCPALSLKRNDGSDLQMSDLGPMTSGSYSSNFNCIVANKKEPTDCDKPHTLYDPNKSKPVVAVDRENDQLLNLPNRQIKPSVSLLRARLSGPVMNVDNIKVQSATSVKSETSTGVGSDVI